MLAKHGFLLRKYCSTSKKVIQSIRPELCVKYCLLSKHKVSVLGINWCTNDDAFRIKSRADSLDLCKNVTKQKALWYVAGAFDPSGLVSPVIVTGKLIIQEIWREGISWDESVSKSLESSFNRYTF